MSRQIARIRASVCEMAAATVEQVIGQSQMNTIRTYDPNPYFFSMVIAHEGESRGEVVGFGAKLKEWGKRVIRQVANAFHPAGRVPAKIYDGLIHYHGNQDARLPVGDVVHSSVAELNGLESVQTIGYIYPNEAALRNAIANGERDCCSLEGDAIFVEDGGRLIVSEFEGGKAVVLGHTDKQLPGFPGAIVRPLAEFGPEDAAGGENPPASPVPPATPPPVALPPVELTKEQVVAGATSLGLVASDFGFASAPAPVLPAPEPVPLPPPIPAPPAQPTKPETQVDLRDRKFNPFL